MNRKKEEILKEIEILINHTPKDTTTINPNYLEYLEIEDLESIRNSLLAKIGKLNQEDISWLEQFKKY